MLSYNSIFLQIWEKLSELWATNSELRDYLVRIVRYFHLTILTIFLRILRLQKSLNYEIKKRNYPFYFFIPLWKQVSIVILCISEWNRIFFLLFVMLQKNIWNNVH